MGRKNVSVADQSVTPVKHSTPRRALKKLDKDRKKLHVRFEQVTNDLGDLDTPLTPLPDIKLDIMPINLLVEGSKQVGNKLRLRKQHELPKDVHDADIIAVQIKICDASSDEANVDQTSNQRRFWIPVCHLSFKDKFTIQSGKWLDNRIIDAAHDMIPGINGFQQCTLVPLYADQHWEVPRIPFQRTPAHSVQIHHIGHSHWVTSFQRAGDNRVFLLDSLLPGPELPASLQIQLAQIYGSSDDQMLIEVPHLSKQDIGSYCGLYAIANMLEFCKGGLANVPERKLTWEFQQDNLRSHLISCFSNGNFSVFPRTEVKIPKDTKTTSYVIQVVCPCGLPNLYADMIGCDTCYGWHHKICVGVEKTALPKTWSCPPCTPIIIDDDYWLDDETS